MTTIIVADSPEDWPLDLPNTEVVTPRRYLTDHRYFDRKRARVFNLCAGAGYQTLGYYVSLLAAARGHRPLPAVTTAQNLKQHQVLRVVSSDLRDALQRLFAPMRSDRFTLSIYFGRNLAKRYDRLCQTLFNHFPAPLMRAELQRTDQWRITRLALIGWEDIPASHHPFVLERARRFFSRPRLSSLKQPRYELAILVDGNEVDSPSDEVAIARFGKAARKLGLAATLIGEHDAGRLAEFDALFIRATTSVDHYTYRFASRAAAEGLVVIDDPESIVRCTNKVYQAELFAKHGVSCPETMVVHRDNAAEVGARLGFPCVLKRPDSSFSAGVVKAADQAELDMHLARFFETSELVVAQPFIRSDFDWRIGVLDGKALYACRYYFARGHWQVQRAHDETRRSYGKVDTVAVHDAPAGAVELATRAASLIGRGLYGVDIKERAGRFDVIEINDNPSLDGGNEDAILKDDLYLAILGFIRDRLDERTAGRSYRSAGPSRSIPPPVASPERRDSG